LTFEEDLNSFGPHLAASMRSCSIKHTLSKGERDFAARALVFLGVRSYELNRGRLLLAGGRVESRCRIREELTAEGAQTGWAICKKIAAEGWEYDCLYV
jgi:hypothetical protein